MYRLKRLTRIGLIAGAAAVLVAGPATSAQAASGTLFFNRADTGARDAISSPPNNECLLLGGGAGIVDNRTNAIAFLYRDENCTVLQDSLGPGQSGAYGGASVPHSVEFGTP
ncbi:hypothetical protein ACH41H_05635 [Streptomyces sp. NPDC020800]|uniref:hypothetical protein n=1 Tax=Streptomyces sp. NPDC020800 TaxID=3365092 RepID=UPI00379780A7